MGFLEGHSRAVKTFFPGPNTPNTLRDGFSGPGTHTLRKKLGAMPNFFLRPNVLKAVDL